MREHAMDEENKQRAREIIEKAQARSGLITVLTRHLESSDDLLAKIAAAELLDDPNWLTFTRGIVWYHRRRRKIARKRERLSRPMHEPYERAD